jgi:lipopolysaccharide transport system ATP-binding protein
MLPAITVSHLSKKYQLTEKPAYLSLRDLITSLPKKLFSNTRQGSFYALKDVSFKIFPGEIVGIIGRNGAGKSTLLKILSRVTEPTSGKAFIKGRIGSLLEIGTGFHPELSGRENILLNGAILGMSRVEIQKKIDRIIAFAEIKKFIDTPVKHYSSGMYVRLAFAIASQLEPDILLIDEILAVGDAQFQQKSLKKMRQSVKDSNRTILIVSHNMAIVRSLCKRCLFLDKGKLKSYPVDVAVKKYLSAESHKNKLLVELKGKSSQSANYDQVKVNSGRSAAYIDTSEPIDIELKFTVRQTIPSVYLSFYLENSQGIKVIFSDDHGYDAKNIKTRYPGRYTSQISIPSNLLAPDQYYLSIGMASYAIGVLDVKSQVCSFNIRNLRNLRGSQTYPAVLDLPLKWKTVRV